MQSGEICVLQLQDFNPAAAGVGQDNAGSEVGQGGSAGFQEAWLAFQDDGMINSIVDPQLVTFKRGDITLQNGAIPVPIQQGDGVVRLRVNDVNGGQQGGC